MHPYVHSSTIYIVGFLIKECDLFLMNWALIRLRAEGPDQKHKGHMTSRYEARIYIIFSESIAPFLFYKVQHQLHILLCHLGRGLLQHMKFVALKDTVLLIQQCHLHNLLSHLGSFLFPLSEICISIFLCCKSLQNP